MEKCEQPNHQQFDQAVSRGNRMGRSVGWLATGWIALGVAINWFDIWVSLQAGTMQAGLGWPILCGGGLVTLQAGVGWRVMCGRGLVTLQSEVGLLVPWAEIGK